MSFDLNYIISWLALAGIAGLISKIFTDKKGTQEKPVAIIIGFLAFGLCLVFTNFPQYTSNLVFAIEILTFVFLVLSFYYPKFSETINFRIPNKKKNIELLQKQLTEIPLLRESSIENKEFTYWRNKTEMVLSKIFGKNSDELKKFSSIYFSPMALPFERPPESFYKEPFNRGLNQAESIIKAFIDSLDM